MDDAQHLRELIDERTKQFGDALQARDKAVEAALSAQREALKAALDVVKEENARTERSSEKRFESVNEFRGQQSDLIRQFVTREVLDATVSILNERVEGLMQAQQLAVGQSKGVTASRTMLFAVVGALLGLGTLLVGAVAVILTFNG